MIVDVYVDIVGVVDVSQFLAIDGEGDNVALVVVDSGQCFPRQDNVLRAAELLQRFQRAQQVAERGVHQDQSTAAAADHQTHFGRYGHRRDGRFVAGQGGPRCRTLGRLAHDRLRPGVPVPQQHSAVLRS